MLQIPIYMPSFSGYSRVSVKAFIFQKRQSMANRMNDRTRNDLPFCLERQMRMV